MGKKNTRTSSKTLSSREIEHELSESEVYDEYLDAAYPNVDEEEYERQNMDMYNRIYS